MSTLVLLLSLSFVDYSVALIPQEGGGLAASLAKDSSVPGTEAPLSPGSVSETTQPSSTDTEPSITIISPATWYCQHCPSHRNQDWSGFSVTLENRDGLTAYPCTEWTDSRGVTQRLYGRYTPTQVRWSWQKTQENDAAQSPTPIEEVRRVLALLKPQPSETFVDYGCGDGRWLIEAVRTYRCQAIGVEIDPEQASRAVEAVNAAGLSSRIQIVVGDATTTDVRADVGVAYLYPDVLVRLKPKLLSLSRFASYMHRVDGVAMAQIGNAWVWHKPQPVAERPQAVWSGRTYSYGFRGCGNPGCAMCNSINRQLYGYR